MLHLCLFLFLRIPCTQNIVRHGLGYIYCFGFLFSFYVTNASSGILQFECFVRFIVWKFLSFQRLFNDLMTCLFIWPGLLHCYANDLQSAPAVSYCSTCLHIICVCYCSFYRLDRWDSNAQVNDLWFAQTHHLCSVSVLGPFLNDGSILHLPCFVIARFMQTLWLLNSFLFVHQSVTSCSVCSCSIFLKENNIGICISYFISKYLLMSFSFSFFFFLKKRERNRKEKEKGILQCRNISTKELDKLTHQC